METIPQDQVHIDLARTYFTTTRNPETTNEVTVGIGALWVAIEDSTTDYLVFEVHNGYFITGQFHRDGETGEVTVEDLAATPIHQLEELSFPTRANEYAEVVAPRLRSLEVPVEILRQILASR